MRRPSVWRLTLPGEHAAPVRLELQLAQGLHLVITAQAVQIRIAPDGRVFESLAC